MLYTVTDRIKGKFIGAFIVSWLAWNWKVVYVTLFVSEKYTGAENKIEYIKSLDIKWCDGFWIPLVIAIVYIVLVPFSNRAAEAVTNWHRQKHKKFIADRNKENLYNYEDLKEKLNPLKERIDILSKDLNESERDLIRKDKAIQKLTEDNAGELKNKDEKIKSLNDEVSQVISEQTKKSEEVISLKKTVQSLETKPSSIVFDTFEAFIENIDLIEKIDNNNTLKNRTLEIEDLNEFFTDKEIKVINKLDLYEQVENGQMLSLNTNRFNMYNGMINYIQDFESRKVKGFKEISRILRSFIDDDLLSDEDMLQEYYKKEHLEMITEKQLSKQEFSKRSAQLDKKEQNHNARFKTMLRDFDDNKTNELITKAEAPLSASEKADLKIFYDSFFKRLPDDLKVWLGNNLNTEPFKTSHLAKINGFSKYMLDNKYIKAIKGGYVHFTDDYFVFFLKFVKYMDIDFDDYKNKK